MKIISIKERLKIVSMDLRPISQYLCKGIWKTEIAQPSLIENADWTADDSQDWFVY